MDRRTFLKSSGAAAAAASASTVAAEQAQAGSANVTQLAEPIRTALPGPFAGGYLRDRADRLALRLRELSEGRINLRFEAFAGHGIDAVTSGAADAYFGCEADHIERHGALAYFSALPGDLALGPEHFTTWLSAGGGQMCWDATAGELGCKALAVGHSGRRTGIWSKSDVTNLADLSGQTIATQGLAVQVAQSLGLRPITGETADLTEPLMGPTAAVAVDGAGGRRFWLRDGLNRSGVVLSLGLALPLWEKLSDADRAMITTAAHEAFHQNVAEHDAHDRDVAPHLFDHHGIQKMPMPNDVRHAIDHASHEVIGDFATQNSAARRIHENYMMFRKNVVGLPDPLHSAALV